MDSSEKYDTQKLLTAGSVESVVPKPSRKRWTTVEPPTSGPHNEWEKLVCSSHMRTYLTLNKLANKLELAERALRTCTDMFDTIAFRGMSGAFLGPALALRLKKQMILCRKPDDDSHSFIETEGYRYCKSYVIVDDFVSTCNTINKIGAAVFKFVGAAASCIGVLEINYLLEGDVVKAEQGVGTCAIITHQEHMNNLLDNLRKGFLP